MKYPNIERLIEIVATLRGENGCQWDKEQTHSSLRPNMLEEAYEAIDAIDDGDIENLKEELGDVLLQVVLHAQIAKDNGNFDIEDVAKELGNKLIHRHPHVFGDIKTNDTKEILANWEKLKLEEKKDRKIDINAIFNQPYSDEVSNITAGMVINGDITSQGSLELVGAVHGNINVSGKMSITGVIEGNSQAAEIYAESAKITGEVRSLGTVKVGQETVIIGDIYATSAVIAGAVKGDIDVHGPVILDTTAIVMGNIKSKSVQINNGAVIEGMCSQCYADVNPTSFFDEIKKAGRKK